ncbi:MAG: V-type ATP synthase subunit E [Candidatus Aminicenantes bacterium]|nr:V-type ATP synthase subunit E [Candidatus Aminicenantes bacterium]
MEIQLQELLDRIKRDGLEAAEIRAATVLLEAEERKKTLLAEAEREAAAIRESAKTAAAREEEAGRAALARASRDLILSFRDKISAVLDAVVRKDVSVAYDADVLREVLPAVLKSLAAGGSDDLSVLLDPATMKKIEGRFDALLGAELKKGVELKPFPDVSAGFRVAEKNGAAYYDFSAATVAELFSKYLNNRLAEIVRNAAKGI